MLEKIKYFLCILSVAMGIGIKSDVHAQPAPSSPRLFGSAGLIVDSRSQPYRAITIDVPTTLTTSYPLHLPSAPPTGPISLLASDVNGNLLWTSGGTASLPALPPNNIWVGNASSVATPYAPTTPGTILTLNGSSVPTWSNTIPVNTTLSISQLTTGTLQPTVVFNVGPASTITLTGGTNISNKVVGAGPGNFAGSFPIPANAVALTIPYPAIQAGATVLINIIDPSVPGVSIYLQSITPGAGFTVQFSAPYPGTNGKVSYQIINVTP